jgi:predicted phage terminase large subunit-like protein
MKLNLDAWADEYAATLYALAPDDFGLFRQLIRPDMFWGWWNDEVARELHRFYLDLKAGRRPKLALMAPPQHGKSTAVLDFIAWIAGKDSDLKTIFASYSDELGTTANRYLFRTISNNHAFRKIFPDLRVGGAGWAANNNIIEFVGRQGSFRNTTVDGAINGFGLDLGVVDDPVKGAAEANSKLQRDKTWEWFVADFFNRFAKDAGLVIIMTRWHVDDVLGRMLERFGDDLRVLRYPAVVETTSWHWRKELTIGEDGRCRFAWKNQLVRKGEALFPEHKPLSFLDERRKVMTQGSWEALYQQHPIIVGGGELPIEKLHVLPYFDRSTTTKTVRYWDKAGTADRGAFTAGVLMHKCKDGTYVISHIVRGRWSALEREERIKRYTQADGILYPGVKIWIEQEPGSGGKESVEATIRNLAGYSVYADKVSGSKQVRAQPFAAQVQAGNVSLRAGPWVQAFWDECEVWPKGQFDDQVDAAAGAFNKLTASSYDSTYAGFQDVDWQGLRTNLYLQSGGRFRLW